MDLLATSALFEQFLDERRFLKNVTPAILQHLHQGVEQLLPVKPYRRASTGAIAVGAAENRKAYPPDAHR